MKQKNMKENYNTEYETEYELLEKAFEAVSVNTGVKFKRIKYEVRGGRRIWDARVTLRRGEFEHDLFVEFKRTVNEAVIGNIATMFKEGRVEGILATSYVSRPLAEKLKMLNIQFIDVLGNAYINTPPIYLFVYGKKKEKKLKSERNTIGTAGLKVIFALLRNPDLAQMTFREIMDETDVSLSTVQRTFIELNKRNHLVELGNGKRKLVDRRRLLNQWVEGYAEKLRDKQLINRYRTDDPESFLKLDLRQMDAVWGGEVAAQRITRYLEPEIFTIYIGEQAKNFVVKFKLIRDTNGLIELRKKFWRDQKDEDEAEIAPTLLVYADLIATGIARNIETAERIYDKHIDRHLRED